MGIGPGWQRSADAWFKVLAAIALGYIILAQAIVLLKSFGGITIIAVGAVLLAYLVYPAIAWLNGRLPLWAALAIVYTAGLFAVAGIFYAIVPLAIEQLHSLVADWPTIERSVSDYLDNPSNPFYRHLPAFAQQWLSSLPTDIGNDLRKHFADYSAQAINALGIAAAVIGIAIAIPVTSVYMLGESSAIKRSFLRNFPARFRRPVLAILSDIDAVIGGFVRGQLIVAAVVGILSIVALVILHVRYAVIIGLWAGAMDVIPYIGPAAGTIPAVIIAFIFNGLGDAIGVIVAFVVINQLEGHLLAPRIVSSTVKISPLAVIFALLISAKVFGFFGLLVAVPLAGIIRVLIVHLVRRGDISELDPGATRS